MGAELSLTADEVGLSEAYNVLKKEAVYNEPTKLDKKNKKKSFKKTW